jgi:hypothetical protein
VGNRKRSHTHFLLGTGKTKKKKKKNPYLCSVYLCHEHGVILAADGQLLV